MELTKEDFELILGTIETARFALIHQEFPSDLIGDRREAVSRFLAKRVNDLDELSFKVREYISLVGLPRGEIEHNVLAGILNEDPLPPVL